MNASHQSGVGSFRFQGPRSDQADVFRPPITCTLLPPDKETRRHPNIHEQEYRMNERKFEGEQSLSSEDVYVSLTYDPLNSTAAMARVKSPKAGAVVLFAGQCPQPAAVAHSN